MIAYPLTISEAFITDRNGDALRCAECDDTRFDLRLLAAGQGPVKCTTCGKKALPARSAPDSRQPIGR